MIFVIHFYAHISCPSQPPELRAGSSFYDPAAFDVWSLGVVLFFLVVCRVVV